MPPTTETERQPEVENQPESAPTGQASPKQPAQRGKLLRLALVAGAVLMLAVGFFWLHGRNRESTDDAQVDGHIAPTSAKIPGSIVQVLVDNNQHVQAGQVLVRLDPRDYQARVDQLRAAVAAAEAQATAARAGVPLSSATTASGVSGAQAKVESAQAEYRQAQVATQTAATSAVAEADADVAQAEANARKAQADLERMRPLIAKAEISQQQFDSYVAAAQVAAAQLNAARQRRATAGQNAANAQAAEQAALAKVRQAGAELQESRANRQQVNVTEAQAKSAEAAIQQARANLAAAELDLSYTTIQAPVEGVVTQKTAEPGQTVQPGQALMTVVPLSDVWVTANFKETQLSDVHPGQYAEVKVDMYGRKIPGRVHSIAGATGSRLSLLPPENATGNFVKVVQRIPVKIVFDRPPDGVILRPGMNVDVTIHTR